MPECLLIILTLAYSEREELAVKRLALDFTALGERAHHICRTLTLGIALGQENAPQRDRVTTLTRPRQQAQQRIGAFQRGRLRPHPPQHAFVPNDRGLRE